MARWDTELVLDHYPDPGGWSTVSEERLAPGGTTANMMKVMAQLGADVTLFSTVGDDDEGKAVIAALRAELIRTDEIAISAGERTERATVIVSDAAPFGTTFWYPGARLRRGCRLDIPALFGGNLLLLDVDDLALRRFLIDLPVHTFPSARLLGTLTHAVGDSSPEVLVDLLRCDALVGTEQEVTALMDEPDLNHAIALLQERLQTANCRLALISQGFSGATAVTATARWSTPMLTVEPVDAAKGRDIFVGAAAYAFSRRWPSDLILEFANTTVALSTRGLGGRAVPPSFDDVVDELITGHPPTES